jgi:A/G-specific adenine glycosylase
MLLQSTRVAAVLRVFPVFISSFPSPTELSQSSLATVRGVVDSLGLGETRASNLIACGLQLVTEYGGEVPSAYDDLMSLPGVGDYTARAVQSIAFGFRVRLPPSETNVKRVVSRLIGLPPDMADRVRSRAISTTLEGVLSSHRPGDHNQAWMEIGQRLCKPSSPLCSSCPLQYCCVYSNQTVLLGSI